MSKTIQSLLISLMLCAALLCPATAQAVVLDWSSVSWPNGSLSRNFNIDGSNPGNDVTITISGSTSRFINNYPHITEDFTGGFGSGTDQLDLYVNFNNVSQFITVTVTFNYANGVDNVNFTLFDVDTADSASFPRGFIDQVRDITAVAMDGSTVIPTITGSANNVVLNAGTSNQIVQGTSVTADVGSGSGNANAYIDFGDNAIQSFTFTYGNSSTGVVSNPAQQGIGLYDIGFDKAKAKVPEVHVSLAAVLLCFAIVVLRRFRDQRRTPSVV